MHSWPVAALFAISLTGCADVGLESGVESPRTTWELSAEPILTVGLDDTRDGHILAEISEGELWSDGAILADLQTQELRGYGPDGDLRWSAAGRGEGPGDFQAVQGVRLDDDGRIHATDALLRKVVVFDTTGAFIESRALDPQATFLIGAGAPMRSGAVPVAVNVSVPRRPQPGAQVLTVPFEYRLVSADSSYTVAEFDGDETYGILDGQQYSGGSLPFGARTISTGGSEIAAFGNGRSVIHVVNEQGRAAPISSPFDRLPVSDSVRNVFVDTQDDPERAEEVLSLVPLPDSAISYDRLTIDARDRIWVRRYGVTAEPKRWDVLAPDGEVLGTMYLPADSDVLDARGDRVLLRRRTALAVPFVEVYELRAPGNSSI